MKLIHTDSATKTNIANAKQFGISSNSAKLFSMLSTALYSNKEVAVLHELGANCADEHVFAKVDKPWSLTLPTTLEPYIRFRDYGRGLSEENVYLLLTTYGESTKSDSNIAIGAFGIGAKSPAAVTSTWNVISRYSGELKEYLVFIDRTGIPSITLLRTEKTTETGLEVIIPVNQNRISAWSSEITNVYKHYKVKPEVLNFHVKWPKDKESVLSGSDWNLFPGSAYYDSYYCNVKFITSNREYPVDNKTLKQEFANEKFLTLLPYHLEVKFEIGELDLSLSRESLQYTHHTLDAIKTKLSRIYSEFNTLIHSELDKAKDGLEYREILNQLAHKYFGGNATPLFAYITSNKYNVVDKNDLVSFKFKVPTNRVLFAKSSKKDSINTLTSSYTCGKTYAIGLSTGYGDKENTVAIKIHSLHELKVVIADTKDFRARVKHNFKTNLVLISDTGYGLPSELKRFVVKSSELSKAPRAPKGAKQKPKTTLWTIWKNSFIRRDESDLDKTKTWVCVEFSDARQKSSIPTIQKKYLDILDMNPNMPKVIAVRIGEKCPKFATPIAEYMKLELDRLNTHDFIEKYAYASINSDIRNSYENALRLLKYKSVTTQHNSVWNKMRSIIEEYSKIANSSTTIINQNTFYYLQELANIMGVELASTGKQLWTVDKISKEIYNTYTMLEHVESTIPNAALVEYLNLIGK